MKRMLIILAVLAVAGVSSAQANTSHRTSPPAKYYHITSTNTAFGVGSNNLYMRNLFFNGIYKTMKQFHGHIDYVKPPLAVRCMWNANFGSTDFVIVAFYAKTAYAGKLICNAMGKSLDSSDIWERTL